MVQDTDSLPEASLPEGPVASLLDWPVPHVRAPDLDRLRSWDGWVDLAWVVLWILGLAGILIFERWEAIPFHLIWITFALLYSFRVRSTGSTLWVLAAMVLTTFAAIGFDVLRNTQLADELTQVPLMAAMFWVMMCTAAAIRPPTPSGCGLVWRTSGCSTPSAASCRTRHTSSGRRSQLH